MKLKATVLESFLNSNVVVWVHFRSTGEYPADLRSDKRINKGEREQYIECMLLLLSTIFKVKCFGGSIGKTYANLGGVGYHKLAQYAGF